MILVTVILVVDNDGDGDTIHPPVNRASASNGITIGANVARRGLDK